MRKPAKRDKRVLFIADAHTGHQFGLTPPNAWTEHKEKIGRHGPEAYLTYKSIVDANGPYDVVVLAGDCIDGDGERSKATELLASDRVAQIHMFMRNLHPVKHLANPGCKWFAVFGTAYHTGRGEDFEALMADSKSLDVDMSVGAHTWLDVNGYVFDIKHHVGRSALPHGKYTPIARDALWNELWAAHGGQPRANAIVRGHTHYMAYCGDPYTYAMTLPCLTWGSKYGSRRCSEEIHWGLAWCDVSSTGKARWDWDTRILQTQKAKVQVVP